MACWAGRFGQWGFTKTDIFLRTVACVRRSNCESARFSGPPITGSLALRSIIFRLRPRPHRKGRAPPSFPRSPRAGEGGALPAPPGRMRATIVAGRRTAEGRGRHPRRRAPGRQPTACDAFPAGISSPASAKTRRPALRMAVSASIRDTIRTACRPSAKWAAGPPHPRRQRRLRAPDASRADLRPRRPERRRHQSCAPPRSFFPFHWGREDALTDATEDGALYGGDETWRAAAATAAGKCAIWSPAVAISRRSIVTGRHGRIAVRRYRAGTRVTSRATYRTRAMRPVSSSQ